MAKIFNTTGLCIPEEHYMVNIDKRLKEIKELVDGGKYFTINKARQYGKTTTLTALDHYLQKDYYVVSMDFQTISNSKFEKENSFCISFSRLFLRSLKNNKLSVEESLHLAITELSKQVKEKNSEFELPELFEHLSDICNAADKPIVLMIDEVDSATNNQVFIDFLAQLRAQYLRRFQQPALKSVILAGVHDVKNLRRKLRPEDDHKVNSPWNIAADFKVDMSFSEEDIAGMLQEYEANHRTGMDIDKMAQLLHDYTSGYPYLVSRLCKLIDEEVCGKDGFDTKGNAWSRNGFHQAVKMILTEKNTLFESLSEKLISYPELNLMLRSLLFAGKAIAYNYYEPSINIATMFGFVKEQNNVMVVANRIFETWLYNYYLSATEMHEEELYVASLRDKNQFVVEGHFLCR